MRLACVAAALLGASAVSGEESVWARLVDKIDKAVGSPAQKVLKSAAHKHPAILSSMEQSNGQTVRAAEQQDAVLIPLDGGWTKFFFGAAGTETAYRIVAPENSGRFVRIAITDAYCPGDAFDLSLGGRYLLSTPRVVVPKAPDCGQADPDAAQADVTYSSSRFMLPGALDMSIGVRDSPYGGGAAFVRADTLATGCVRGDVAVVTAPLSGQSDAAQQCARLGRELLHVRPENALGAALALQSCGAGASLAWAGRVSLAPGAQDAGCVAFDASSPSDPTVRSVDCSSPLPVLCM